MSDKKFGIDPVIPFRLGVVAAVALIAGMVIGRSQDGVYDSPLLTLAFILIGIGVLAAIVGALFATLNGVIRAMSSSAATAAMGRVKQVAAEVGRPKITSTSGMSTADELEKWARLRDTGVVSQQEFEAARAELLKGR